MGVVINIHDKDREIDLPAGKYKIDVLGGFWVELEEFSVSLKHNQSGETVNCERSFWPVQSIAFNKRAKRIFTFEILQAGTYLVEFSRPETLKVKYNNLFFSSQFQEPEPNEKISIYIH